MRYNLIVIVVVILFIIIDKTVNSSIILYRVTIKNYYFNLMVDTVVLK